MQLSNCFRRNRWKKAGLRLCGGLCRMGVVAWMAAGATAHAGALNIAVAKTPLSLPIYIASQKGFFADEGLDVTLTECSGGHRCLQLVLEGQADVSTSSELPIVFNSFERTDFAVIATMVTTSQDVKLLAHTRSRIAKPMDLAGKRVGAVARTSSQYFLELYLLTIGLNPQNLTVVNMQPEEMSTALQNGQIDAVALWEPYAYSAIKALGRNAVVLPPNRAYILTFNLVAHRNVVKQRDSDLVRLLRAVERAERFIRESPVEAKWVLRNALKLDQGFVDWVWAGATYRLGLDQSLISTMEGEARWARREGHVTGAATPNFLGLMHMAPLKTVNPSAVGIHP